MFRAPARAQAWECKRNVIPILDSLFAMSISSCLVNSFTYISTWSFILIPYFMESYLLGIMSELFENLSSSRAQVTVGYEQVSVGYEVCSSLAHCWLFCSFRDCSDPMEWVLKINSIGSLPHLISTAESCLRYGVVCWWTSWLSLSLIRPPQSI